MYSHVTGFRVRLNHICTVVFAIAISGCSGVINPSLVQVSGKVTYNGKPVEAGVISFIPVGPTQGKDATATIQKGGTFQATTISANDGVFPGEYYVTIVPPNSTSSTSAKSKIPVRYHNLKSSGIIETFEAGAGSRQLEFVLTDDE